MIPNVPFVSSLLTYSYPIAYPLAIVEGPILMLVSGFLVKLGLLSFWPIYLVLVAGDLTGDIIWYWIGRHGARTIINKYGRFFNLTEENVLKAEKFFHTHQTKILFLSKITMGFGFALATLVAAGAAKVSFKKYMTINFFGEFVWAGFLIGAGYLLGNLYTLVDRSLRIAFIISMVVVGGLAVYGFGRFMRTKIADKISEV